MIMSNAALGLSVDVKLHFAFPRTDGKWTLREGTLSAIDGMHHQLAFAGFETRARVGFGITATYHIAQNLRKQDSALICDVMQIITVDGRVEERKPQANAVQVIVE